MKKLTFKLRMGLIWLWMGITSIICYFIWIAKFCLTFGRDRSINRAFMNIFSVGIRALTGISTEVRGREHTQPGKSYVLVCNHQSGLDLGILSHSSTDNTVVIGKKELLYVPIFGPLFWMSDNILISRNQKRKAHGVIQFAAKEIKRRGVSIYIFPEGTRNKTKDFLLPFKKGAFHMAIAAQVPVVPVVCQRLHRFFDAENYEFHPGKVIVEILPPVETAGMTEADTDRLMKTVRGRMLDAFARLEPPSPLHGAGASGN